MCNSGKKEGREVERKKKDCFSLCFTLSHAKRTTTKNLNPALCNSLDVLQINHKPTEKEQTKTLRSFSVNLYGLRVLRAQPHFEGVERRSEVEGVEAFGHRFDASMLVGERRFFCCFALETWLRARARLSCVSRAVRKRERKRGCWRKKRGCFSIRCCVVVEEKVREGKKTRSKQIDRRRESSKWALLFRTAAVAAGVRLVHISHERASAFFFS